MPATERDVGVQKHSFDAIDTDSVVVCNDLGINHVTRPAYHTRVIIDTNTILGISHCAKDNKI